KITERLYHRAENSAGLATYHVLIPDDGTLTASGTVTVRFRFNGKGSHDPSLADVWTLPVPADTTPPGTELEISHAGEAGWFTAGATATLTASDARSEVASTEYRLGGGDWHSYTDPVALPDG